MRLRHLPLGDRDGLGDGVLGHRDAAAGARAEVVVVGLAAFAAGPARVDDDVASLPVRLNPTRRHPRPCRRSELDAVRGRELDPLDSGDPQLTRVLQAPLHVFGAGGEGRAACVVPFELPLVVVAPIQEYWKDTTAVTSPPASPPCRRASWANFSALSRRAIYTPAWIFCAKSHEVPWKSLSSWPSVAASHCSAARPSPAS